MNHLHLQVMIQSLEDAHEEIDKAISAALTHSKPVYICICCNLAGKRHTWLLVHGTLADRHTLTGLALAM